MSAPPAQLRAGPRASSIACSELPVAEGHADHFAAQSAARAAAKARRRRRLVPACSASSCLEGEHLCAAWLARPAGAGAARDRQRCGVGGAAPAPACPGGGRGRGRRCRDPDGQLEHARVAARRSPFSSPAPDRATVGAGRADARPRPSPGRRAMSAACCAAPRHSASPRRSRWSARRPSGRPKSSARRHGGALRSAPGRGRRRRDAGRARRCRCSAPARTPGSASTNSRCPGPCAWVFGHEGQGVADGVARQCRAMLRHSPAGRRRIAQCRRGRRGLPVRDGTPARPLSGAAYPLQQRWASCRSVPRAFDKKTAAEVAHPHDRCTTFRRLPCDS